MEPSSNTYTGFEVAVIGMSGRFPGASNPAEFWNNLENGVESISFFTPHQLEESGVPSRFVSNPNYVPAYGSIEGKEYFDSAFFGYLPDEARVMDPQVRMFHECVWEALEDSGYNPEIYRGLIGIYAGAGHGITWELHTMVSDIQSSSNLDPFFSSLIRRKDFLTTGISYNLNLRGPSITLTSACSTSLVAVHEAVQSLLSGECDMAAAGGITLNHRSGKGYMYQEGGILSPDGHCRAFDRDAKGTVSAEGAGVVILKPLDSATQDRDHIYAIIRASFINNDGRRKVGFTAPSVEGQAEAIRHALTTADIPPDSIGYIETHGTGTALGDPVEIEALRHVFGSGPEKFCALGSLKTNVGHMDSAAGVAALIKAVLALKHRRIPPTLHFNAPNPTLSLDNSPFFVDTEPRDWANETYPLRAGVSSFGIGGTNAHVILEEAPGPEPSAPGREYQLFVISARTATALERMTERYINYFKEFARDGSSPNPADIAYTLQAGRKTFPHRRTWVARDAAEAADILTTPEANRYKTLASGKGKEKHTIIFMFPGQGAQYINMGKGLYLHEPLFRDTLDTCFRMARELIGKNLKEILFPAQSTDEAVSRINQTEYTQPLLFFIEYALARLLMSWGIEPDMMIGHSIGEYAAACLSGVFTIEEAVQLVLLRGRLMQEMPAGSMLSVALSGEEAARAIKTCSGVSLAARNAPGLSVLSGPDDEIDAIEKQLTANGVTCRRLHTSHAFHSPMMDPVIDRFEDVLKVVNYNPPKIPFMSDTTGKIADETTICTPGYWSHHLREAVDFSSGVQVLLEKPNALFIEVGPGKTLGSFVRRHPGGENPQKNRVVNLMRHPKEEQADVRFLLERVGELWLYGIIPDWELLHEGQHRHRVPLPTYPFDRVAYPAEVDPLDTVSKMIPEVSLEPKDDPGDWFYVPSWKRTPLSSGEKYSGSDDWLVFIDEKNMGLPLLERIRAGGGRVVPVRPAREYREANLEKETVENGEFFLDPAQEEHMQQLFSRLKALGIVPGRIVYMWQLVHQDKPYDIVNHHKPGRFFLDGYSTLLSITRAIGTHMPAEPVKLFVLTGQACDVLGTETAAPLQSSVLGPVRVIPREYANIDCRTVDIIPEDAPDIQWDNLLNEFSYDSSYREVAYRGIHRWVRFPEPVHVPGSPEADTYLRRDSIILITGGLGGIGFVLARFLAERYHCTLILIGRRQLSPELEKKIKELEQTGATVRYIVADVADALDLKTKLAAAEQETGEITGIIHAAGIGDYAGVIQGRNVEDEREIMDPKVRGTLVLDRIASRRNIQFFFLCSSLAASIGPFGQVAYCTANTFLHAYAAYKSRRDTAGTRFVSVGWDAWKETGMAVDAQMKRDPDNVENALRFGISSADGIDVFLRALGSRLSNIEISTRDIQPLLQYRPIDDKIREPEEETPEVAVERPELTSAYAAPGTETEIALTGIWENFFGIGKLGKLDNFFELGGDSLKATALISRIHHRWNIKLPLADIFRHPTIEEQARQLDRLSETQETETYREIEPAPDAPYYPLSFNQERLLFLHRMDPGNPAYHIFDSVVIPSRLTEEILRKILRHIVHRHDSFRTRFIAPEDTPVQEILPSVELPLTWRDISPLPEDRREKERNRLYREAVLTPFKLETAPLLRVEVIQSREDRVEIIFVMHHIISDGWSVQLLKNEFQAYFLLETAGDSSRLPEPLTLQYKDFALWQHRQMTESGEKEKQIAYWKRQAGDDGSGLPAMELPYDFAETGGDKSGAGVRFFVSGDWFDRLIALTNETGCSIFSAMLAPLCMTMNRICKQERIVTGILGAGRGNVRLDPIVGFFVNTLLFKCSLDTDEPFNRFLEGMHGNLMEMLEHQGYPLELIYRDLGVPFPTIPLIYDVVHMAGQELSTAGMESFTISPLTGVPDTKFDISVKVFQFKDGLDIQWYYRSSRFNAETVEFMIATYAKVVAGIVQDPAKPLQDYLARKKKKRLKLS